MNIHQIAILNATKTEENVIAAYDALYGSARFSTYMEAEDLTCCEMIEWLEKLIERDNTSREEEWGSEKQIEAQNEFFWMIEELCNIEEFADIEGYAMKATTEEMQNYALEIINK